MEGDPMPTIITDVVARDIRFPTSRSLDGSDAMNTAPDYSAAYVVLKTDSPRGLEGHGLTFTTGRGTEVCVAAINALKYLVLGKSLESFTANTRREREAEMLRDGYPAYTTSTGWLGYPDDKVRRLCREALAQGWTHFKIKVGRSLEDDMRRSQIIREEIGLGRKLMMDANQV